MASTSTSGTGPSPEVLEEINLLFSWNPPRLVLPKKNSSKKSSTATHQPAFYDKHFSSNLVVKKVVRLPSLVQDLARNVDKVLGTLATLPPLGTFITAELREFGVERSRRVMKNEKAVVEFYGRTTADYCLFVASTLALHPSSPRWGSLLTWTQSAPSEDYAIMDGQLVFIEELEDDDVKKKIRRAAIVESMDSKSRAFVEAITESGSPLATWKMKSLSTGSPEVMTAICTLGELAEFPWVYCTDNDCNTNENHQNKRDLVKLASVGPDAQPEGTPWSLPGPATRLATQSAAASGSSTLPVPFPTAPRSSEHGSPMKDKGKKRPRGDEEDHHDTTAQSGSGSPPLPSLPERATRRVTRSTKASGSSVPPPLLPSLPERAARRFTRSAAASDSSTLPIPLLRAQHSSERGSSMKDKGKKRARDDEEDRHDMTAQSGSGSSMLPPSPQSASSPTKGKRKKHNLPFQDKHDITATKLVQQAWAQAVRVDGTVIVLHSGNQELVCVRHRRSQTLYVSGVIEPSECSNPGYGKLHVGIYIAAIQDAMDRWQQKVSESKLRGDGGETSGSEDQDDQDRNRGFGSGREDSHGLRRSRRSGRGEHSGSQSSAGRKDPTDDELVAIEKAIDVASDRDMVLLYLCYDIYDSPIPASFLRSAPSIMAYTRFPTPPFSPRAIQSCGPEDCLTIVLTSEIGRGATGVVHRGTLVPEICGGIMPLDVVVKLAFDSEQRDALRSEYKVYCHLKSKGVHQGIATALGIFDDSEGCACALVLLYAGVPLSESQGNLSEIDRKSALSTLKSIHRAGILHGDIRQANVLTGDLGATIIDFGHSKPCDDQGAKKKELAQLRSCLRLECKY